MGFSDIFKKVKNTASKAYDQVNPFDSGRSWQTRTPSVEQATRGALSQIGSQVVNVGSRAYDQLNVADNGLSFGRRQIDPTVPKLPAVQQFGIAAKNTPKVLYGIGQGVVEPFTRIPGRIATGLPGGRNLQEASVNYADTTSNNYRMALDAYKKGKIDVNKLNDYYKEYQNSIAAQNKESRNVQNNTSFRKGAADATNVGLTLLTAGKAAKEAGALTNTSKVLSTETPTLTKALGPAGKALFSQSTGIKGVVSTGLRQGAVGGAVNELYKENPTFGGAASGAIQGALTGAAIGGSVYGVTKGAVNLKNNPKTKEVVTTAKRVASGLDEATMNKRNEYANSYTVAKQKGDTGRMKYFADEIEKIDSKNQAGALFPDNPTGITESPKPKVTLKSDPLEALKGEARTEPKFERDLNTGKMKMVSEPKPAPKEKYSIANSDISRTRSPGMNEDGFTVEDWGGKKRYVSLDGASPETKMKVRKAEADYEAAKIRKDGTALEAKQKVNDAYSDAIDDLKLYDYATTESGGRTFNSRYNDWLETKYKDRNVDTKTIKDMAANPQKYRQQFEAESATQTPPVQKPSVEPRFQDPNGPEATAKARNAVAADQADFNNLVQQEPASFALKEDKAGNQIRVRATKDGLQAFERPVQNTLADSQLRVMNQPDVTAKLERMGKNVSVLDETGQPRPFDPKVAQEYTKKNKAAFEQSTNKYLGTTDYARKNNTQVVSTLPKLDANTSLEFMQGVEDGATTGNFGNIQGSVRQLLDQKHAQLKAAGVDIGYLQDYMPHQWENLDKVKKDYKVLNQRAGIQNERVIPTLREGINMGFKPKTSDYRIAVKNYLDAADKLLANREYFNTLKKQGLVFEAASRPPGMQALDAPGFPNAGRATDPDLGVEVQYNWYARPEVAKNLNKLFGVQDVNRALKFTAGVSKNAQTVFLSGGLPGTPLNAFGSAQWLKQSLSGRPISATKDFLRSFSEKASRNYEQANLQHIRRMQQQGIAYGGTIDAKSLSSFGEKIADASGMGKARTLIGESWNKAVEDPTFRRFMPMMQLDTFKGVYEKGIKKGLSEAEASKLAGEATRNVFGLNSMTKDALRSPNTRNTVSTFLFAPRFRESMVTFWKNNAKALRHPTDPKYRENVKFLAGATMLFGAMQAANMALNEGKTTFQNDNPYDKLNLNIPTGNGTSISIPFLSSTATIPRMAINTAIAIKNADPKGVLTQSKTLLSQPVRPMADLLTNQKYNGKPIVYDNMDAGQRAKAQAKYVAGQFSHPWIAAALGSDTNTPLQTLATATEAPIRFRQAQTKSANGTVNVDGKQVAKGQTIKVGKKYVDINTLPLGEKYLAQLKNLETGDIQEADIKDSMNRIGAEVNSWVPAGLPKLKADTKLAEEWAKYDAKVREGKVNKYEINSTKKKLIVDAYKRSLGPEASKLFGVSDSDLYAAAQDGVLDKNLVDKVIALDNGLINAGLTTTANFSNKLRKALGYDKAPTEKSGTASSRKAKQIPMATKIDTTQGSKAKMAGIKIASSSKANGNSIKAKSMITLKKSAKV